MGRRGLAALLVLPFGIAAPVARADPGSGEPPRTLALREGAALLQPPASSSPAHVRFRVLDPTLPRGESSVTLAIAAVEAAQAPELLVVETRSRVGRAVVVLLSAVDGGPLVEGVFVSPDSRIEIQRLEWSATGAPSLLVADFELALSEDRWIAGALRYGASEDEAAPFGTAPEAGDPDGPELPGMVLVVGDPIDPPSERLPVGSGYLAREPTATPEEAREALAPEVGTLRQGRSRRAAPGSGARPSRTPEPRRRAEPPPPDPSAAPVPAVTPLGQRPAAPAPAAAEASGEPASVVAAPAPAAPPPASSIAAAREREAIAAVRAWFERLQCWLQHRRRAAGGERGR